MFKMFIDSEEINFAFGGNGGRKGRNTNLDFQTYFIIMTEEYLKNIN